MEMSFSKYKELYEILIPQDNQWRRMREEIDFSFVYDLLEDSYSKEMGRTAKDVVFMFKLLMLKTESGLSDGGLIKMVNVNMEYKYFLGLDPEEVDVIDSSLLTKFRRQRIAKYEKNEDGKVIRKEDKSQELMDILISKTVELAITKGVIKKKNVGIVDSTHKYSISVLPKNFSSVFIFAEINTKDEIYKSLKKYKKLDLLIDNSDRY